ncbi:MAG: FMN-binding negative transcriptional regulator, partial [Chitinophagaceae bacterium]|nr:FMN-binding negative transcriptional regulator [Chitinophagaceae bacterium]
MYGPKHYTETDREKILEFIATHPFATLIVNDKERSYATQIPVMLDERDNTLYLQGHVSRHTDHYPILADSTEVLLMFTGAHCYVSAGWYAERGQASTWNYMTVQARGSIHLFDEHESLELLKELTHYYEDGQDHPELLENMPEEYVAANVKAIAGFEITVTSLDATFKLSQNRT